MNKTYRIALSLLVVFAISVFSGCVGETESHDQLVLQVEEDLIYIDIRDPQASSAYDVQINYQYAGYLLQLAPGETIVIMPGVAESWTVTNPATPNETWTFKIREGAKFQDGTDITAKDVQYSYYAGRYVEEQYDNVSEAKADYEADGYNITFPASDPNGAGDTVTFSGSFFPAPDFPFAVAGQYWGAYMLVPYGSHGTYDDNNDTCAAAYDTWVSSPISAGPYKFVEHADEDYILFERFDQWYGWGETFAASNGKSYTFPSVDDSFKSVKYRVIDEKAMALVELRTGGIDVTTGRFLSASSLEETNNTEGFYAYTRDTLGGALLNLNKEGDWPVFFGGPGNFPLSETWFRQAVSHALNRTNMVDNVYLGIAKEKTTIFSEKSLSLFPGIDTSDYYDFDQGVTEAEAILDAAGYSALGFSAEPDNRFGWGLYANETDIDGTEQTKGRHFRIITMECDFCAPRVLAVQKDLRQIGIYLDVEIMEWGAYLTDLRYNQDAGFDYNDTGPQPDPNFNGPNWDFSVGGSGGWLDLPLNDIGFYSYVYFMYYGWAETSWFNLDYEVAYAKASDGEGYLWMGWPGSPTDWPYPVPEYSPDNDQFVQACEDAGEILSYNVPKIPLVWYVDTYAMNDKLNNFLASSGGHYPIAYSYWA